MKKKPAICVFCKKCDKPFSVSSPKFAAVDPDLVKENIKYHEQGHRVEFVDHFDGSWCDCVKEQ